MCEFFSCPQSFENVAADLLVPVDQIKKVIQLVQSAMGNHSKVYIDVFATWVIKTCFLFVFIITLHAISIHQPVTLLVWGTWNVWRPEALQAGVLRLHEEWWPGQDPKKNFIITSLINERQGHQNEQPRDKTNLTPENSILRFFHGHILLWPNYNLLKTEPKNLLKRQSCGSLRSCNTWAQCTMAGLWPSFYQQCRHQR